MPNKLTAREHWQKAFDYFWKGDRRRTIKEARLAMKPNPNDVRPHWIEPIDRERLHGHLAHDHAQDAPDTVLVYAPGY